MHRIAREDPFIIHTNLLSDIQVENLDYAIPNFHLSQTRCCLLPNYVDLSLPVEDVVCQAIDVSELSMYLNGTYLLELYVFDR